MGKVSREYYSAQRIIALILIFCVVVGCDAYIWATAIRNLPLGWQIVWWVPSCLLCGCLAMMARGRWGWPATALMALVVCVALPELVYCIISLIGLAFSVFHPNAPHYFNLVGVIAAGLTLLCGLYGVIEGWKRISVTKVEIDSPSLPAAFDGYRIAQISDLHLGTFAHEPAFVQRLVDRCNQLGADLVVFTGDLVNFTSDEAQPFRESLSQLHAPDGVLSILGNHDYVIYAPVESPEAIKRHIDRLIHFEQSLGWRVLLDENVSIARGNDKIWIVGVENIGRQAKALKGDLQRAMQGVPDGAYTILLSHDPSHWVDEVVPNTRIPLTLSGHTHAMQLKVFGWSPSALFSRYWGGHFIDDGRHLFVSTGAGANLPFRFGAWPEIALITLKNKS